jgi:hypothetical protein
MVYSVAREREFAALGAGANAVGSCVAQARELASHEPTGVSNGSRMRIPRKNRKRRMKILQTLRVHNAMVTDRIRAQHNQLRTLTKLGRKPSLEVPEDRNALAFHFIDSGAIKRFSARHQIIVTSA